MALRGWIARRARLRRLHRQMAKRARLRLEAEQRPRHARRRAGYKNLTQAEEQLWDEIGELFEDDEAFYASADIGFHGLTPGDVEGLWEYLRARTGSVVVQATVDPLDDEHIELTAPETEGFALRLRTSGDVGVCLVEARSKDQRLPNIQLGLAHDEITLYWWVGLDYHPYWTPKTVAAFATLLGELRELVPHARLEYEDHLTHDFWGSVERFVAAERRSPPRDAPVE